MSTRDPRNAASKIRNKVTDNSAHAGECSPPSSSTEAGVPPMITRANPAAVPANLETWPNSLATAIDRANLDMSSTSPHVAGVIASFTRRLCVRCLEPYESQHVCHHAQRPLCGSRLTRRQC
ncbi:hypothetical protein ColTof3_03635 [Colletotrichum tofieldiae]|nr:hypothetical protein ColTof3_03635 [Colletotrichum tofieldiae]